MSFASASNAAGQEATTVEQPVPRIASRRLPPISLALSAKPSTATALPVSLTVSVRLIGPVTSDTCTYSVNPDGTGVSTATFSEPGAPASSSVAFVIVEYGRELRAINTDATVAGFVAKRQY